MFWPASRAVRTNIRRLNLLDRRWGDARRMLKEHKPSGEGVSFFELKQTESNYLRYSFGLDHYKRKTAAAKLSHIDYKKHTFSDAMNAKCPLLLVAPNPNPYERVHGKAVIII